MGRSRAWPGRAEKLCLFVIRRTGGFEWAEAETSCRSRGGALPAQAAVSGMSDGLKLRILFVEDEADIRETLAEILQLHDYEVVAVESAELGMAELKRGHFDLLLTDYNLPGQPGIWLIEEGRAAGLMNGTAVLIVTAHPMPRMAPDVVVMRKPLDIDHFLRKVGELLEPAASAKVRAAKKSLDADPRPPQYRGPPLELTLYVSPDSPASLRAVRNINALLEKFPGLPLRLTLCDLTKDRSGAAERDRIAFTPTLVKTGPGPRVWILGTLDDLQPVLDLLELSGLVPSPAAG